MENEIKLRNPSTITFTKMDAQKGHNDIYMVLHEDLGFEMKSVDRYIRDAKNILNQQSKRLNSLGIERLLAALIMEVVGNQNYGQENQ